MVGSGRWLQQRLGPPALQDRLVKESTGLRHGQHGANADSPGRLTEDRHVLRVATEGSDLLLDPVESRKLVQQPLIPRRWKRLAADVDAAQIAESPSR